MSTVEREKIKKLARRLDKCHRASLWVDETHKDKTIGVEEEMCAQFLLGLYEASIFLVAIISSKKSAQ